jgi:hypothetical protein
LSRKLIDLTGQTFNRLTVIKRAGKDEQKNALWLCKCSCSEENEKVVRGYSLMNGDVQSCGCLIEDWRNGLIDTDNEEDVTGVMKGLVNDLIEEIIFEKTGRKIL